MVPLEIGICIQVTAVFRRLMNQLHLFLRWLPHDRHLLLFVLALTFRLLLDSSFYLSELFCSNRQILLSQVLLQFPFKVSEVLFQSPTPAIKCNTSTFDWLCCRSMFSSTFVKEQLNFSIALPLPWVSHNLGLLPSLRLRNGAIDVCSSL